MAELWKRRSVLKSWAISRTRRWKGSLRISSSVLFWYLRISRRATVPGRYRWGCGVAGRQAPGRQRAGRGRGAGGRCRRAERSKLPPQGRPAGAARRPEQRSSRTFFTPPVAGALLRAALVASCFRGALPPVLLLRRVGRHRAGGSARVPRAHSSQGCVYAPGSLLGAGHGC